MRPAAIQSALNMATITVTHPDEAVPGGPLSGRLSTPQVWGIVLLAPYVLVFLGLICLTVLTTAVAFVDLGPFSVVAALGIATCKMLLVALFFMHVRHSTRLTRLVVLGGLLWLGILIAYVLTDYLSRGWTGVPGN